MSRKKVMQIAWGVAVVLLLLATGKAFRTAGMISAQADRFDKKVTQIQTLKDIHDAMRPLHAAREAFVLLPNKEPVRLGTLVRTLFQGTAVTISPIEIDGDRETAPGWEIHQVRIDLGEQPLPIPTLMKFVYLAEKGGIADDGERAAPPWRLVNCHLWASPHKPGYANGVLHFEALEAEATL